MIYRRIRFFTTRSKSGIDFFRILSKERYPNLVDFGLKMGSMFGNTYLCESTFSTLKFVKSRYRCSLSDDSLLHLLQLATTGLDVDIPALVRERVRPKCSH